MNEYTTKRLERLQNILMRCLLGVPDSTPLAAMNWDCGMLSMDYRVKQKKLMFLHYLVHMEDETLAKQTFNAQKDLNLPGFLSEGRTLLGYFNLPNLVDNQLDISKSQWRNKVNKAIKLKYEEELKGIISKSTKLKDGPMRGEQFEENQYLKEMSMMDARTLFRIRSQTTTVQMNQRSDKSHAKNLWKCLECGNIDSQSHIVWCPFFSELREGKSLDNNDDLVKYFQQIFKIREEKRNELE